MVEEINELAILFKREITDDGFTEEFVPFKVIEGRFVDEEALFVDSKQNVYIHMAADCSVGNVFAGRRNLGETLKINPNRSLNDVKKIMLDEAIKYFYFKNIDEDSSEYGVIKMTNKDTNEEIIFVDKDSNFFYQLYKDETDEEYDDEEEIISSQIAEKEVKPTKKQTYNTPKEIVDEIKQYIKGQDAAVEAIVTLLWMKYKHPSIPKTNFLVIGPSGSGKTAIFERAKDLFDVPLVIHGLPGTSQAGFKGHDLDEALIKLYYNSDKNVAKAETGIVIIDEFDKIANTNSEGGEIVTVGIQNELLKMIEGNVTSIELSSQSKLNIDTKNIIFVCSGAFSKLFEKKKEKAIGFDNYAKETQTDKKITTETIIDKGGIIRELAGRLPVIIQLNTLTKDDLKDILLNAKDSIFVAHLNDLLSHGITVENLDELIDTIVDNAIACGIGARGLIKPIKEMFMHIFYEIDNNPNKYEKIIIGKNILNDNRDYTLIPKKVKTKTRKKIEGNLTN